MLSDIVKRRSIRVGIVQAEGIHSSNRAGAFGIKLCVTFTISGPFRRKMEAVKLSCCCKRLC